MKIIFVIMLGFVVILPLWLLLKSNKIKTLKEKHDEEFWKMMEGKPHNLAEATEEYTQALKNL